MIASGPAIRGLYSCLALILSIVLLCGLVALFGERVAAPGLAVWLVVAVFLVYLMASAIRSGKRAPESGTVGNLNGAGARPVESATGAEQPFRGWLVEHMVARDLTAMGLALQLAVRDDRVEDWIQGRGLPSPIECARLAALFGATERDVLRLTGWSK